MAGATVIRTFAAGELSRAFSSRADLAIYQAGVRRARNFIIGRNGSAYNRAGTEFVNACKTSSANVRLVPYVSELADESVAIEFGAGYLRFHHDGELVTVNLGDLDAYDSGTAYTPGDLVVDAGVGYYAIIPSTAVAVSDTDHWYPLPGSIYEIPCPFTDPSTTRWQQSGRLITFTSQSVKLADLHYEGPTRWWFDFISVTPTVAAPANVLLTADGIGGSHTFYSFDVVVIQTDTFGGPAANWSGELPTVDSGHHGFISWRGPLLDSGGPDVDHYEVYANGTLIGTTSGTDFEWDGSTPGGGSGTSSGTLTPRDVSAEGTADDPTITPFRYVVTALDPTTNEESLPSDPPATGDLPQPNVNPHRLSWDEVMVGAVPVTEYRVYVDLANGGPFYYIGSTGSLLFINTGITQDTSRTPPTTAPGVVDPDDPNTFPAVCAYFQQRRFIANTLNEPDRVRGSKTAEFSNFTTSSPVQDSDAISFRLAGNNGHAVRALVVLKELLLFTDGGEWRMVGDSNGTLTPSAIRGDQETYVGIHDQVPPVAIGNAVVYLQARGRIMRDLQFSQQVQGLAGRDLTLFASHLFDRYTITGFTFQQSPDPIVWATRSDGALLGLTYIPEAQALAWHRHDTGAGGDFEQVCTVPETDQDTVYAIVRRDVNGSEVRYVERFASRSAERTFLDCAIDSDDAPRSTQDGLDHLEGATVGVYADGAPRGSAVVTGGSIALGGSYSSVVAGLPIVADLFSLPLDAVGSDLRNKAKRVQACGVLLDRSAHNFLVGPSAGKLVRVPNSSDTVIIDEDVEDIVDVTLTSSFERPGRVFIRHDKPTPLTIVGLLPYVEVGG